jgi:hypothetical protein
MTITRMPASAIPNFAEPGQSPLGRYLASHLVVAGGGGLAYDLVGPVMEGALAVAALEPFDTLEMVQFGRGSNNPESRSLLESVLRLTCPNRCCGELRQWPKDAAEFGEIQDIKNTQGKPLGVDTEWVAAALTAVGCNPWVDFDIEEHKQPPEAAQIAIIQGMGGLVERFLDCSDLQARNGLPMRLSPA